MITFSKNCIQYLINILIICRNTISLPLKKDRNLRQTDGLFGSQKILIDEVSFKVRSFELFIFVILVYLIIWSDHLLDLNRSLNRFNWYVTYSSFFYEPYDRCCNLYWTLSTRAFRQNVCSRLGNCVCVTLLASMLTVAEG